MTPNLICESTSEFADSFKKEAERLYDAMEESPEAYKNRLSVVREMVKDYSKKLFEGTDYMFVRQNVRPIADITVMQVKARKTINKN